MRFLGLIAAASLILSGCAGYHVGPIKPTPMKEVRTVAVPTFTNLTLEPRLEVLMATALIRQLQQDGTYRVTSERDADAIVECTVNRIDRTPARGIRNDTGTSADFYQTTEFTLNLQASLKVSSRTTGETLAEREFTGNSSFFVSGANPRTANVNRDERQAIPQAAEDLATQITSFLSEGW
jgi:PBP1b-binding outer membrane lipoprotein LpoB